jgi:hypothetical protein
MIGHDLIRPVNNLIARTVLQGKDEPVVASRVESVPGVVSPTCFEEPAEARLIGVRRTQPELRRRIKLRVAR